MSEITEAENELKTQDYPACSIKLIKYQKDGTYGWEIKASEKAKPWDVDNCLAMIERANGILMERYVVKTE